MQGTIRHATTFKGAGLHSGRPVRMTVAPAEADTGIRFVRTDLRGKPEIAALWCNAEPAVLCTRISDGKGAEVTTIEHLMAALAGTGIHNAFVLIDGPEVPILDGSAAAYVARFLSVGVRSQACAVRALRVLAPVMVQEGAAIARLEPADRMLIDFEIDFPGTAIGHQMHSLDLANGAFVRELSDCRTFCRWQDVEAMRARGLALGGTLENAVVVDGHAILTPGGLRRPDEAVRHKMLDALGDLALAGGPILGRYSGTRAGHALTGRLLRTLFDTPDSHEWITLDPVAAHRLPGAGVGLDDLPLSA